jgi:hypothetical protein
MEMMKDVPVKDRPPSYIVRLAPNPVLDALYEAVGLRTIIIDPEGRAQTAEERSLLLDEFMLALSMRAGGAAQIPGTSRSMFVSPVLLRLIERAIGRLQSARSGRFRTFPRLRQSQATPDRFVPSAELLSSLEQLAAREVPTEHMEAARVTLALIARRVELRSSVNVLVALVERFSRYGPSSGLTYLVSDSLMSASSRVALLQESLSWEAIWAGTVELDDARVLIERITAEVIGHVDGAYEDEDVAYAIDLGQRIMQGQIIKDTPDEMMEEVRQLMYRVAETYPAAASYKPALGPPKPSDICREITQRIDARRTREEEADDSSVEI